MDNQPLREKVVQSVAADWLHNHYSRRPRFKVVRSRMEVATTRKRRADGLVFSRLRDGSVYVASLEAKSQKTLRDLLHSSYDDPKWLRHASIVGATAAIPASLVGLSVGGWVLTSVVTSAAAIGSSFVFLRRTAEHPRYKEISVVTQVQNYPANERWIGLSRDAYLSLGRLERVLLQALCRQKGIGLLLVSLSSEAAKVRVVAKPLAFEPPLGRKDYLSYYAKADELRRLIET